MILLVLGCWAALSLVFAGLWLRQRATRDATSVDVAWTLSIGALAAVYALARPGTADRAALVALPALGWSVRLAAHLYRDRVRGGRGEDARYRALREAWGPRAQSRFFRMYQIQAAAAVLFSLPLLGAMRGGALGVGAWLGLAVWAIAMVGESLADAQLARFRARPDAAGEVCREGLWRYSRHPNYFFEWLHWWAYVLIGGGAPLTWIGPAGMLYVLLRATGIPWAESQALRSRGERYREYMRTTSAFVPLPPRRPPAQARPIVRSAAAPMERTS